MLSVMRYWLDLGIDGLRHHSYLSNGTAPTAAWRKPTTSSESALRSCPVSPTTFVAKRQLVQHAGEGDDGTDATWRSLSTDAHVRWRWPRKIPLPLPVKRLPAQPKPWSTRLPVELRLPPTSTTVGHRRGEPSSARWSAQQPVAVIEHADPVPGDVGDNIWATVTACAACGIDRNGEFKPERSGVAMIMDPQYG